MKIPNQSTRRYPAGGLVLVWMGIMMLRGNSSPTAASPSDEPQATETGNSSLTPVILFAASPGTITGVITLAVSHSAAAVPTTALFAVVIAVSITWVIMVITSRASGGHKPGLVHDVTSRFMGLIVLAMGVPLVMGHLSWLLINADRPVTGPDQVRFQAKAVLHNALLAGLVVAIGGFFNNLNYGAFPSWMLALFVVGICWIVAACLWYAADKIEKKMEEKKLISQ